MPGAFREAVRLAFSVIDDPPAAEEARDHSHRDAGASLRNAVHAADYAGRGDRSEKETHPELLAAMGVINT
jgi:hypothetical protein